MAREQRLQSKQRKVARVDFRNVDLSQSGTASESEMRFWPNEPSFYLQLTCHKYIQSKRDKTARSVFFRFARARRS